MKIIIGDRSLVKASLNFTGNIHVNIKEFTFPEESWNDFVVIIITWWLESLDRILNQNSNSETFRFMDGPFSFNVVDSLENYEIEFYHSEKLIKRTEVSKKEFKDSIVEAAKAVNILCLERNWNTKEVIELRQCLTKFE